MNSNLIDIITQYLRIDTNYAVIINGKYGVGKTHFFKYELSPKIKEVPLKKDDQKKFTPIHISLFGFKTLDEIQTAIFVELFPILKNKGLKLAAGIGKSIIRGIAQINKAGDIDKYIGDMSQDVNEWLSYDELVICFDDLDRKSESLDLRDILGFINSLVENQGVKILIIANEEQLIKDKNYSSKLREKVIGISIQFSPNSSYVFEQITKNKYESSYKVYYKFLEKHKAEIISAIEKNENNFRNLIFFLEHFKTIFYSIELKFENDKDFAVLKEEKQKAILDFSLAISIEFKLGLLNSTNIKDIEGIEHNLIPKIDITKFLSSSSNQSQPETNEEPSYIDLFKEKYFSENKYHFFKSIFEYITGSRAFDVNILEEEIGRYFIIEKGVLPNHEIVLRKLGYSECLKLSTTEYRQLTKEMLTYLDEGLYQLNQFGTIFHFATRFNNLLSFNFEKLKDRFKRAIKKGIKHYKYDYNLSFYMSISHDTEFKSHVLEIINFCLKINDSLKETQEQNTLKNIFDLLLTDFNKFVDEISGLNTEFRFTPFWLNYDVVKIYNRIRKLDNDQIWKLSYYFKDRYRQNIYEGLFPEKEFVVKIIGLIDNNTKERKIRNLKNASLDYLSKCMNDSVRNFPN